MNFLGDWLEVINPGTDLNEMFESKNKPKCFSCPDLISSPDAAGGGTYKCRKYPNIIIGEWGHWTNDSDPTPICK